jgi:cobalamin synthase
MSKAEERDSDEDEAVEGRNETELERVDRNMIELLNELRVALPGVQVLFAFLLVLPFNQRFHLASDFQKNIYLLTLIATALSAILLIAPSMHHRLQFREGNKREILRDSNRLAIAGMSVLAIAMCGAVVLVTDFVFARGTMVAALIVVAVAFAIVWYALPIRRLIAERD